MLAEPQLAQVKSILRALSAADPAIDACALVTNDGHVLAAMLPSGTDRDRIGAMCASLLALGSRASDEIQRGQLQQVILEGAEGTMMLTRAGPHGVLAVACKTSALLGKMIISARSAAGKLAAVIPG